MPSNNRTAGIMGMYAMMCLMGGMNESIYGEPTRKPRPAPEPLPRVDVVKELKTFTIHGVTIEAYDYKGAQKKAKKFKGKSKSKKKKKKK